MCVCVCVCVCVICSHINMLLPMHTASIVDLVECDILQFDNDFGAGMSKGI